MRLRSLLNFFLLSSQLLALHFLVSKELFFEEKTLSCNTHKVVLFFSRWPGGDGWLITIYKSFHA